MRVMMICLNRFGGTLKCASRLAQSLSRQADLKLVVSAEADADLLPGGVDTVRFRTGSSAGANLARTLNPLSYHKINRAVKMFNPDVLHFPVEHLWHFVLQPLLGRLPMVQTIHDPSRHLGEGSRLYDLLRRKELSWCDRIIVLSEDSRTCLLKQGVAESRVDVVEHGVFTFGSEEDGQTHCPPPPGSRRILFAGRITQYKGLDVLLKAFPIVCRRIPDAHLTIAGKGDLESYRPLLASLPGVVVINRYVSERELASLHVQSDIVVAPYLEASQSGVIAMALSNGRPVVATRVGALAEQVEDKVTGHLVPPKDPAALADAIIALLSDYDGLLRMADDGRKRYEQRFGWDYLASKTLAVYRKALDDWLSRTEKR